MESAFPLFLFHVLSEKAVDLRFSDAVVKAKSRDEFRFPLFERSEVGVFREIIGMNFVIRG